MSDIIIVLGNYLLDDGSLSLVNRERCFHAYSIFLKNNSILLLTGGKANTNAPLSEGEAMKNFFLGKGVGEELVIVEDKSKNTFENTKFCAEILRTIKRENVILVSSSYHINRGYFNPIKFFAKYQKLAVIPSACFDSGIKQVNEFRQERESELVIYSKTKKLLEHTNNERKNYFAIKRKGKQQYDNVKMRFWDSDANAKELVEHLKVIYNLDKISVQRI